MKSSSRIAAVGLIVLGSAACDTSTGPSDGVTVFEEPGYQGDSRTFDGNEFDLEEVRGPCNGTTSTDGDWDDCMSSIRVPAGWEITVYEDPNYEGGSRTFLNDVSDLEFESGPCGDDWENCVSAIRVSR